VCALVARSRNTDHRSFDDCPCCSIRKSRYRRALAGKLRWARDDQRRLTSGGDTPPKRAARLRLALRGTWQAGTLHPSLLGAFP